jgi:ferritin-like metal-binding protein YciE
MDTETLTDLFIRELEETYLAEKLLLDRLSNPPVGSTEQQLATKAALVRTHERAQQLERTFALTQHKTLIAERSAPAALQSINAVIQDREAGEAANMAALRTFWRHLHASYAKLALWATLLGNPDLAEIFNTALAEEKAELTTGGSVPKRGQTKEPKSISLGERLTAMFDRKR